METYDTEIINGKFEHNEESYDCSRLIERDKETILRQADATHKEVFDELYRRDSLEPFKAKLSLDKQGNIVYLMIVYRIHYKVGTSTRLACGDYYPVFKRDDTDLLLLPHPFQGSICW